MFIADHLVYVSRRRKSHRRYWWAGLAFIIGLSAGYGAAQLF